MPIERHEQYLTKNKLWAHKIKMPFWHRVFNWRSHKAELKLLWFKLRWKFVGYQSKSNTTMVAGVEVVVNPIDPIVTPEVPWITQTEFDRMAKKTKRKKK